MSFDFVAGFFLGLAIGGYLVDAHSSHRCFAPAEQASPRSLEPMAPKPGPDAAGDCHSTARSAVMYCRARCYPNASGYRVDFRPTGGNELQHPLPQARWFPSLGEAMAWAYEVGNTSSLRLDGLTLTSGRDLHT